MSVCQQFHVERKCDVTERERERDAQIDYHKEFRTLGGTLPKDENCCAWALRGSVSLHFAVFDSNCFEGAVSLHFAAFVCSVVTDLLLLNVTVL